jgi:hypothetical protein
MVGDMGPGPSLLRSPPRQQRSDPERRPRFPCTSLTLARNRPRVSTHQTTKRPARAVRDISPPRFTRRLFWAQPGPPPHRLSARNTAQESQALQEILRNRLISRRRINSGPNGAERLWEGRRLRWRMEDRELAERLVTERRGPMHPETHLRYHSERQADLLREARKAELASSLGEMRRAHRRQLAPGLWPKRFAGRLTLGRA